MRDEKHLHWTSHGGVTKATITTANLGEVFKFLGQRPIFMDRWFVTSDDPEHTKRQFAQIVVSHRPALEILYNECRAAHKRGDDAVSSSSSIALELGNQDVDPNLMKTIQLKRHLREYGSSLTMAEVFAGSLLLHLDEIVQSLVIELTHHTHWLGVGELFYGIPLSDALKACGNFVRHKTAWTLQMSRRGTLDAPSVKSLWRLGALLTEHPDRDHVDLSHEVFRYDEHMRRCVYTFADLYQDRSASYQRLEDRIVKLGCDIIDAKWPERLPWGNPNATAASAQTL
jgi:hypothetical protein